MMREDMIDTGEKMASAAFQEPCLPNAFYPIS
jgi:hypothetical protein